MTTAKSKQRKPQFSASLVLGRIAANESLIDDRYARTMLGGLLDDAERVEDPTAAWQEVRAELCQSWDYEDGPADAQKPFVYRDGVAVIPIHGILLNRFNWCWGCVTGYDFIRRQVNLAAADPDVKLIAFDVDSPGGEAAGCDELAREIAALDIPTISVVNSLAASGGFWLAASAKRLVCVPSGSVGSIGVYIQHMNIAGLLKEWGLENTFVKAGEYKTSGNMFEPLSEKDLAYLQGMVDERYDEFCAAVAEFRGIEESVVKGTGARVMRPTEALSLGLIDAAESPTTAVSSYLVTIANDNDGLGDERVEDQTTEEEMAEISSEDRAAVQKETQQRIRGIMTHEEAKGREALAEHLAYETDNTVEQAVAMLKVAPKAQAEEPKEEPKGDDDDKPKGDEAKGDDDKPKGDEAKGTKSQFEQQMDAGQHPNVGKDGTGGSGDKTQDAVNAILGDQAMIYGRATQKKQGKAA